jgi:hypothetical protein
LPGGLVQGYWPTLEIDHIDRDKANNRMSNLREADSVQNQANKAQSRNAIRTYKGVQYHGRKWMAQVVSGGKKVYVGHFDTPEEASDAQVEAAKRLLGEFAPSL